MNWFNEEEWIRTGGGQFAAHVLSHSEAHLDPQSRIIVTSLPVRLADHPEAEVFTFQAAAFEVRQNGAVTPYFGVQEMRRLAAIYNQRDGESDDPMPIIERDGEFLFVESGTEIPMDSAHTLHGRVFAFGYGSDVEFEPVIDEDDPALTKPADRLPPYTDIDDFRNGFWPINGVSVIQSPVSEREANYWVNLHDGGGVSADLMTTGLFFSGDFPDEREQLYVGRDGDKLTVQYSGEPEDLQHVLDGVDDATAKEWEARIREAVAELGDGVGVEFTNSDTWDYVQPLYSMQGPVPNVEESGDVLSVTTENVLGALVVEPGYTTAVDGTVMQTVYDTLRELGADI